MEAIAILLLALSLITFFLFLTSATYYRGKQGLSKQVPDPSTEVIFCAHLPLKKTPRAKTKGSVSKSDRK